MQYGICNVMTLALRGAGSHSSEMVSQLLFGECYEVLKQEGDWYNIKCAHDGYLGWISPSQIYKITEEEFNKYKKVNTFCSERMGRCYKDKHPYHHVSLGSPLVAFDGFAFVCKQHSPKGISKEEQKKSLNFVAKQFRHTPYLWGGRSYAGVDCSGYIQIIYRMVGINLPRDSSQQAKIGETVELSDARMGDLAFFKNDKGRIVHVGMVLDGGHIIHALGHVRVDSLYRKGIFNKTTEKYSHQLAWLKRIL